MTSSRQIPFVELIVYKLSCSPRPYISKEKLVQAGRVDATRANMLRFPWTHRGWDMLARRPTDDRDVGVEPALDELAALSLERVLLLRRTGGVNVLSVAGPSSVGASAPASPLPRFIAATLRRPRLLCSRHRQASTPVRVRLFTCFVGTRERWLLFRSTTTSGSKTETYAPPLVPPIGSVGVRD